MYDDRWVLLIYIVGMEVEELRDAWEATSAAKLV